MNRSIFRSALRVGLSPFAVSLLFSMAVPVPGSGQGRDDRPSRAEMERQFRQQFQAAVRRSLSLSEAQSNAVQAIVDDMQDDRRRLAAREYRLQRKLRSDSVLTAAESTAALNELVAIQQEEARLMTLETTRLRGALSDAKVLAFYDLREAMGRRIQNLRRGGGERGGGERGGGNLYFQDDDFDPFAVFGAPSRH